MGVQMQYEYELPTITATMFKTGAYTYEVIYPEFLDNGTAQYIVRKLKKRTLDFSTSPPTWGSESEIDVATPSGLSNPIMSHKCPLGYDFENDRLIFLLGEWDGTSKILKTDTAKIMAVKRDFSQVTVLHSDVLSLIQSAISDASRIEAYAGFGGYGGKIVGAVAVWSDSGTSAERSCILKYDGSSWSAVHANSRYDYVQEDVEPIWDENDNFLGWLTEGHGTNSHFIEYPDLSIEANAPGGAFTTEPIFDPINHKVIWIEWGSSTGATQHVWTADPTDPFNATDVTPSGTKTDNEGNTIDLNVDCKSDGSVFSDGTNDWLVVKLYDNPNRNYFRAMKATLGSLNDANAWDFIEDTNGSDEHCIMCGVRCYDPTNKKALPVPFFITASGEYCW